MWYKEKTMVIQRGGQRYVYRSLRVGDKARKVYIGKISSQQATAYLEEQHRNEIDREERARVTSERDAMIDNVNQVQSIARLMVRLGLLLNGHYLRRSEIRRMRRAL